MNIAAWLQQQLARPKFVLLATLLAGLLCLPSLWGGFAADDHFIRMVVQGFPGMPELARSPLDTFVFASGDPQYDLMFKDRGLIPWWSLDTVRLSFWRPLASLTHYLDVICWGNHAAIMHLENILVYMALVFTCGVLYRRLLGPGWIAGLATLLYAIDDVHAMPVGWIANRNALLAVLFGVLLLIAHDRWRRDRWTPGAVLAMACLALGLLCGEASIAVGAYLLAYALFIDPGRRWTRFAALAPYALLVVVWRTWYVHLGYGAQGSGMYLDPAAETGLFVTETLKRLPVLLLAQFGGIPSPFYIFIPEEWPWMMWVYVGAAVAFLVFTVYVLFPLLRRDPVARFWLLGTLLAVVPVCATFPMDRLLLFTSVGAAGLMAQALAAWSLPTPSTPKGLSSGRLTQMLATYWVIMHLLISPLLFPFRTNGMYQVAQSLNDADASAPHSPALSHQDVVIVNAPSDFMAWHLPIMRSSLNHPVPRHSWVLNVGFAPMDISRTDAHTLVMKPLQGFVPAPWGRMFRGPAYPFHQGYTVKLTGLTITVLAITEKGMPAEVQFRFDAPLEDPSLCWIVWKGDKSIVHSLQGGYRPFTVPAIGSTEHLDTVETPHR